jgi:hypothetical protein
MPLFGAPNVDKMAANNDIPNLIKALDYKKDATIREQAAAALVKIGSPAIPPLLDALKMSIDDRGQAIADILVSIGEPTVEPLYKHVEETELALATWKVAVDSASLMARTKEILAFKMAYQANRHIVPALKQIGGERCVGALKILYLADGIHLATKMTQLLPPARRQMLGTAIGDVEKDAEVVSKAAGEALSALGVELPAPTVEKAPEPAPRRPKAAAPRKPAPTPPPPPAPEPAAAAPQQSDLDKLTDVSDRWTRTDLLDAMVASPTPEKLSLIEQAINQLTEGDFTPYQKSIDDDYDPNTACQGILYYAKADVFKTDPYAVQAMIPFVGGQADFLSRQLRSLGNGDWFYAVYQLLEAQLAISRKL